MTHYDLTLGAKLGEGGEGAVYALANHPGLAAKIYREPPDAARRAHLEHLIAHADATLASCAAWPLALQTAPDGAAVLILPHVENARELHDFYGPLSRQRYFPGATWADLVRVAAGVARIVASVHAAGFNIADLNEQNILVDRDRRPILIDCDSVMSRHGGRSLLGGVYRAEWLAPELIGADLAATERTANQDCFALAVIIFRLLMLGRHPFVAVGQRAMAEPDAVANHAFVYAAPEPGMVPPATAPAFQALTPIVQRMFVQAFGWEGRKRRPSARKWRDALRKLERGLVACEVVGMHAYARQTEGGCPWCALAPRFQAFPEGGHGGPTMFVPANGLGQGAGIATDGADAMGSRPGRERSGGGYGGVGDGVAVVGVRGNSHGSHL